MASKHRKVPHPLAQEVGGRIRQIRKDVEFSFDAFVEETGLGRGYISELERGLVVPSLATLSTVARALELSIADLVIGNTDRELLFVELREAPPAFVKSVRTELQTVLSKQPAPPASPPPKSSRVARSPRAKML
jgi:transcriptional regulator with XRE-family HTH domain